MACSDAHLVKESIQCICYVLMQINEVEVASLLLVEAKIAFIFRPIYYLVKILPCHTFLFL